MIVFSNLLSQCLILLMFLVLLKGSLSKAAVCSRLSCVHVQRAWFIEIPRGPVPCVFPSLKSLKGTL